MLHFPWSPGDVTEHENNSTHQGFPGAFHCSFFPQTFQGFLVGNPCLCTSSSQINTERNHIYTHAQCGSGHVRCHGNLLLQWCSEDASASHGIKCACAAIGQQQSHGNGAANETGRALCVNWKLDSIANKGGKKDAVMEKRFFFSFWSQFAKNNWERSTFQILSSKKQKCFSVRCFVSKGCHFTAVMSHNTKA